MHDDLWWLHHRGRRVPIRKINGVERDLLTVGDGGEVVLTFHGEYARFHNSLFVYLVDDDGRLEKPRLVWADASDRRFDPDQPLLHDGRGPLSPGDRVRLSELYDPEDLAPGQEFGFLLVANGYRRNPHRWFDDPDGFRIIDRRTGETATLDTAPKRIRLVHEGEDGTHRLKGKLFFTTDPDDDGGFRNPLNPDLKEHVVSTVDGDGDVWLAFEDLHYRDRNFRDLFIEVDTDAHRCPVHLDTALADQGRGIAFIGDAVGERTALALAYVGDFDGDGHADVAIGAPQAGDAGEGALYLYFGSDAIPAVVDLAAADDVVTLTGENAGDALGTSLAAAGDLNGDGFDDLVIGAIGVDTLGGADAGAAYVLFGGPRPQQGAIGDLAPSRLARIDGLAAGDELGRSVAGGGDIDGDGFADIVIGARLAEADYARYSGGLSYVLFGGADGVGTDLAALDGSNGLRFEGAGRFDQSGRSVAVLGDIDGDGFDDFAIGAPDADPGGRENAGAVYVVFGTDGGYPASFGPDAHDGIRGLVIEGESAGDFAGFAVAGAGDINGDGFDDIVIGAYGKTTAGGAMAGAAYVVFGHDGTWDGSLDLGELDGSNGFAMFGLSPMSGTGRAVASAGDVNGDGFDDILVGARYADPEGLGGAGEAYLVFGHGGTFAAELDLSTLDATGAGCTLQGTRREAYAGYSFGGPGDIDGDGFADPLIGAPSIADAGSPGAAYLVFGEEIAAAATS